MNDLIFDCPHCTKHFELPEDLRRTAVYCPSCGRQMQMPQLLPIREGEPGTSYTLICNDGKRYSPLTADQLLQLIKDGRADKTTDVQIIGHGDWKRLGELPEFAVPLSNSVPIPPPPPLPSLARAQPSFASRPKTPSSSPHHLTTFPVAVIILLHFVTFGLFTFIWLNVMHGKMCRVRADDPSAGRAVGFCFIPFFNFYWIFFTFRRLCLRIDEQRGVYGLQPSNLRGLATTACIFQVIPYLNILIGYTIITPIFAGMMQSSVNQLVRTSVKTFPRTILQSFAGPERGISGVVIAAIICACLIPVTGLLSAIAFPSFMKAQEVSQRRACIYNMRQLEGCKEQAALVGSIGGNGKNITEQDVSPYLKNGFSGLICPKGGFYTINPLEKEPMCSEHGSLSEAMERR